jgi:recombination protein RecA
MTEEKQKEMDQKLEKLNKKYKSALANTNGTWKVIPTGSIGLDRALGVGGVPLGIIMELYGMPSAGKSTLTLEIIAQAQKKDKKCALVDFEFSFDRNYAEALGIDMNKVTVYQPSSQEEGFDLILEASEIGAFDIIVLDSHTAAMPQAIIEGEMGDQTMGLQARNNSKFLGKVKGLLKRKECTLIAISQYRANIGGYGSGMVTTGGNGWKFYADIRVKMNKSDDKKNEQNKTTATVEKNKCGAPYKEAKFNVVYGKGIDTLQEIIDSAVDQEILNKRASWYTLDNGTKIQGDEEMKKYLKNNPEFLKELTVKALNQ